MLDALSRTCQRFFHLRVRGSFKYVSEALSRTCWKVFHVRVGSSFTYVLDVLSLKCWRLFHVNDRYPHNANFGVSLIAIEESL